MPGRVNIKPGETPSGAAGSGTGVTVDLASQPVKSKTVLNSLVGTFGNPMVMGPGQLALNGTAGVSSMVGARNEEAATKGAAQHGNGIQFFRGLSAKGGSKPTG